jgi:hypothetical protein
LKALSIKLKALGNCLIFSMIGQFRLIDLHLRVAKPNKESEIIGHIDYERTYTKHSLPE